MIAWRPVVRQRRIQTSSVRAGKSSRGVQRLVDDQIRAGMDRLDGRGRRAEGMQDLVARRAVDVGAQPADLKLVGIRAAHVKADRLAGRDAHAIGVGVNALDRQRPVRRDGRAARRLAAGSAAERHRRRAPPATRATAGGRQELAPGRSVRNSASRRIARIGRACRDVQARIPLTSSPWTSVRRKSRPA